MCVCSFEFKVESLIFYSNCVWYMYIDYYSLHVFNLCYLVGQYNSFTVLWSDRMCMTHTCARPVTASHKLVTSHKSQIILLYQLIC